MNWSNQKKIPDTYCHTVIYLQMSDFPSSEQIKFIRSKIMPYIRYIVWTTYTKNLVNCSTETIIESGCKTFCSAGYLLGFEHCSLSVIKATARQSRQSFNARRSRRVQRKRLDVRFQNTHNVRRRWQTPQLSQTDRHMFYGPLGFCMGLPGWAGTRKVKPGR